jgi:hypothetical protein
VGLWIHCISPADIQLKLDIAYHLRVVFERVQINDIDAIVYMRTRGPLLACDWRTGRGDKI